MLEVHGGTTNRDLVVVANATPEETVIASADVLVIDGNGKVVDTLRVIVSPLRPEPEEDIKTITIVRPWCFYFLPVRRLHLHRRQS